MIWPLASPMPLFIASYIPRSGPLIHTKPGRSNFFTTSNVWSVDPPSTMTCSTLGYVCEATLSSVWPIVFSALKQTVTTETHGKSISSRPSRSTAATRTKHTTSASSSNGAPQHYTHRISALQQPAPAALTQTWHMHWTVRTNLSLRPKPLRCRESALQPARMAVSAFALCSLAPQWCHRALSQHRSCGGETTQVVWQRYRVVPPLR
jgi:hypothetical protein